MSRKKKLLSIGDISKLTGASIRSIRYYEQINLLTPAFIDPYSGYRYYSFEQSYHIEIIMFCAFLNIPLKELPSFMGMGDTMDYRAFLAHGKEIARMKIKTLKNGLRLINGIEQQMDLAEKHEVGQIYTRQIPEKYFICKPCKPPLNELDRFELIMSFSDTFYAADEIDDMAEHGFMCEYGPKGASYYVFVEVPKCFESKGIKKIPAATYYCRQDKNPQIEQTHNIFKKNLAGLDSIIAIETEILTNMQMISRPLNELRVVGISE